MKPNSTALCRSQGDHDQSHYRCPFLLSLSLSLSIHHVHCDSIFLLLYTIYDERARREKKAPSAHATRGKSDTVPHDWLKNAARPDDDDLHPWKIGPRKFWQSAIYQGEAKSRIIYKIYTLAFSLYFKRVVRRSPTHPPCVFVYQYHRGVKGCPPRLDTHTRDTDDRAWGYSGDRRVSRVSKWLGWNWG